MPGKLLFRLVGGENAEIVRYKMIYHLIYFLKATDGRTVQ